MTGRQRKPRSQAEATSADSATPGPEQQYAGSRPPKFVIEIWAHPRFRERDPNRPLTLCEALELGRQPKPDRQPEPDLEPEAEP